VDLDTVITLLGAAGFGSLLTVLVRYWTTRRASYSDRLFSERKEAYLGLLESWVRQENEDFSEPSFRDVGHWHLRCELVASSEVFACLDEWKSSIPGSKARRDATDALKAAMRKDLC
jgi:hypothetical protein